MKIVQATLEDVDWIVDVVVTDMTTLHGAESMVDVDYLREGFIPYIVEHGLIIVAKDDDTPVGCIGGIVTPALYHPTKKVLTELSWWVREDYRQGSVGARLLATFEASAKNMQADFINMSILPNTGLNTRALEKRGYIHRESSYLLEI